MKTIKEYEVIIVGGSYAGLSAAMSLGRSLRKVLIIDSGEPCNKQTSHSHNFITHDGAKPGVIAGKAREQVLNYNTVTFLNGVATGGRKTEKGFVITTRAGDEFPAKKVVFATGIKDNLPGIKGFSDCWGISVVHCPYCHGYEIRHQKTGIIANGEKAFHLASLVNNLTGDLTILTSGKADFNTNQLSKLDNHNIRVIEQEIIEIEHETGDIKNVVFNDGSKESFAATYAAVPFTQQSDIPALLGCQFTEQGYIQVDMMQKTTIDGVYACGDNCSRMRSVANAVSSGNMAGAVVNMELTNEQF